jgi:hypothetical protein
VLQARRDAPLQGLEPNLLDVLIPLLHAHVSFHQRTSHSPDPRNSVLCLKKNQHLLGIRQHLSPATTFDPAELRNSATGAGCTPSTGYSICYTMPNQVLDVYRRGVPPYPRGRPPLLFLFIFHIFIIYL